MNVAGLAEGVTRLYLAWRFFMAGRAEIATIPGVSLGTSRSGKRAGLATSGPVC
jgi:hypothetical protein